MLATDRGLEFIESSSFDEEWREAIDQPDEIEEMLQRFVRAEAVGSVRYAEKLGGVRLLSVDRASGRLRWQCEQGASLAGRVVEFRSMNVVYLVAVGRLSAELCGEVPDTIFRVVRRRHRRAEARGRLFVRFDRASRFGALGLRTVKDISMSGLSLQASRLDKLAGVEGTCEQVTLVSETESARVDVRVRNARLNPESGRWTIGMSLSAASEDEWPVARRMIERTLYPTTDDSESDTWSVHEKSGYLELSGKNAAEFAHIREDHLRSLRKIAAAPEVGHVLHWPREGTPQATMSLFKLYQSTWFMCQLSKRRELSREQSKESLRDLYVRGLERQYTDPEGRWLLIYVQDAAPKFSSYVHIELTKRFTRTGEGCLLPMHAFDVPVDARAHESRELGYMVRPAEGHAALWAMRALCLVRPAQYLDAMDLNERRWDLAESGGRWHAAGMERERQLLIAYQGNTSVALAVVELAEPGVHLYGLLDSLRMFPLRPGGERAFPALLAGARSWFAERGRAQFVYYREFEDGLSPAGERFRDLGGATLTLLALDRVPEILERMTDFTAVRPQTHPRRDARVAAPG